MSKQSSICLLAAVVSTIVITGIGLLIAVMRSMTTAGSGGISAGAGGVSANVFWFALVSIPVLAVFLFLVFSRAFRSR